MPETLSVRVPDIGEFDLVDVVELLVSVGDSVEVDQSLLVLESDKASMEVPSPAAGIVQSLSVSEGSQVGEGSELCVLALEAFALEASAVDANESAAPSQDAPMPAQVTKQPKSTDSDSDPASLLVLGAGPGGYTAAFRAADLGLSVTLVERDPTLGGVCLNVGCIPSKALLHMGAVLEEARALGAHGIGFEEPSFDWARIRARKDEVVGTLTKGLDGLAKARKVKVIHGTGRFTSARELTVETENGTETVAFEQAVLATGSRPVVIPGLPDDPRIVDSTGALELDGPPGRMLVVGGGIIGLEMATVYLAFGWQVTVVELMDRLMIGVDRDLVRPLEKDLRKRCTAIHLGVGLDGVEAHAAGLRVTYQGDDAPPEAEFDRVLIAVGRRTNHEDLGLDVLGIEPDERGVVQVDAQQRTSVSGIFAIGDLTGQPQLAHRATHQGKVAAEVAAGHKSAFDARTIPAVAYTDPEVAWAGLTEEDAVREGIAVRKGVFPWAASGRAIGVGRTEGLTKLLFSEADGRLLGAGIVGVHAGELIAEPTLGIEMGADAADLGLTVHAHPTLSETVAFAAEVAEGTATDLPPPRKR
jgi:dihydrolipoamide dehydrogenase